MTINHYKIVPQYLQKENTPLLPQYQEDRLPIKQQKLRYTFRCIHCQFYREYYEIDFDIGELSQTYTCIYCLFKIKEHYTQYKDQSILLSPIHYKPISYQPILPYINQHTHHHQYRTTM